MSDERIAMKHGAGGRAMRGLIERVFVDAFSGGPGAAKEGPRTDGVGLAAMDDGAAIKVGEDYVVITTDSHVVLPRFFPGGDIGRLAISGTVNDLAMMGATEPLGLTCAVVLEEGFPIEELERIRDSMRAACLEAGASVVTGDTKVMGRGEVDGIVLNTTGVALTRRIIADGGLRPGDKLIVTGTIGDHGMAVMAARHNLALEGALRSDVAPLNRLIRLVLDAGGDGVVALKDPTRGGVAATLHELGARSGVGVLIDEAALPISPEVRAASELLGIEPLHVANEGKAIIGVRPEVADRVLQAAREHPLGRQAAVIGTCIAERKGGIVLDTGFGRRLLAELEGEPMPRIC